MLVIAIVQIHIIQDLSPLFSNSLVKLRFLPYERIYPKSIEEFEITQFNFGDFCCSKFFKTNDFKEKLLRIN